VLNRVARRIDVAIVACLALPLAVFLAGTFRPLPAAALVALLGAGLFPLVRATWRRGPDVRWTWFAVGFAVVLAVVWVLLGGSGHVVYSQSDWMKHDSVYGDLSKMAWPPTYYASPVGDVVLRYYEAYYVVPAALTKAFGHHNLWMQAWTTLGVLLVALRVLASAQRKKALLAMAFVLVFFGGLDVIGWLFMEPVHNLGWRQQVNGWNGILYLMRITMIQYSENTTLLFWVPQHALSAWLAVLVLLHREDDDDATLGIPAFLVAIGFWSVFAAVGMVPFLVGRCIGLLRRRTWRAALSPYVLAAVALAAFLALFMSSGAGGIYHGFIWQVNPVRTALRRLVLFLVFQLLVIVGAMRWARIPFGKHEKIAFGVLLVLPVYYYGTYGDLTMRASIPSLFVLALAIIRAIGDRMTSWRPTRRTLPLALVLLVGTWAAVPQLVLVFTEPNQRKPQSHVPETPTVMADIAADVPPSQYLAAEPDWIAKLMRHNAPIFDAVDVSPGLRTTDWALNPGNGTGIAASPTGTVRFTPTADGKVDAVSVATYAPGLYHVELDATVVAKLAPYRAGFGFGSISYKLAPLSIDEDGEHAKADFYVWVKNPAPIALWLTGEGLGRPGDHITFDRVAVHRMQPLREDVARWRVDGPVS